jgi:hypothetical protein
MCRTISKPVATAREAVVRLIHEELLEIGGERAKRMKHALVVHTREGGYKFFATDMERVGARRRASSVHQVSARAGTIPTRDDIPGRFSTRYLRRREHCEVSAVPCELICGDRAIADGGQFAMQEVNWRAMLRRRNARRSGRTGCLCCHP